VTDTFCILCVVRTEYLKMTVVNPLKSNDSYRGRTVPLTSKRCILYICSTNIGTEYFKHGIYSPFFSSSKCSLFHKFNIFGSCIIHILYTGVLKFKKEFGAKRLIFVFKVKDTAIFAVRRFALLTGILHGF